MTPSQEGAKTPQQQNQRRSRRMPAKGSTRVKAYRNALGLGNNLAVGLLDVAESGARLLLTERLADDHEFEVVLEGPGAKPVKVLAVVVWTVESDGHFVTGVRFQKPLEYAALTALSRF